jgi:hypothetical protein
MIIGKHNEQCFDPQLTKVKVSNGPIPGTWLDGNGNVHFVVSELCEILGWPVPATDAEKIETLMAVQEGIAEAMVVLGHENAVLIGRLTP